MQIQLNLFVRFHTLVIFIKNKLINVALRQQPARDVTDNESQRNETHAMDIFIIGWRDAR